METLENYHDDVFIARWISGAVQGDELTEFNKWIEAHPEEKQFFDDLQKVWQMTGQLPMRKALSRDQRWENISRRLFFNEKKQTATAALRHRWQAIAVAAAVVLMIGSYLWINREQTIIEFAMKGEQKTITLPDRSEVTLNAGSSLSYQKNAWSKKREVILSGEAYFSVIKDKIPFEVNSEGVVTKVLGTTFNIRSRDGKVEVACLTGKVSVTASDSASVVLTPGLATLVHKGLSPEEPFAIDSRKKINWMIGEMYFEREPLHNVIKEIERQFDVQISISKGNELTFTGRIDRSSVQKALNVICLTAGMKYQAVNDSMYTVY
ncbi:FecR domain-containing protein [bacterium]|nr:FecR domain-containing protein [bacterium]